MALYEHSDVLQWGLNILDGDPAYSTGYYSGIIQHDTGDIYNGNYFHSHYENECNHVENDEIIARTLQEEFSQLEIAECSRYAQEGEEQFHASETEPAYDWQNSAMVNYCSGGIIKGINCFVLYSWDILFYWVLDNSIKYFAHAGHDYNQEGSDDVERSSSCSSPCETGESSLELTDNYPLDDEVGRRLSQMIPIPVCFASFNFVDSFLDQLLKHYIDI